MAPERDEPCSCTSRPFLMRQPGPTVPVPGMPSPCTWGGIQDRRPGPTTLEPGQSWPCTGGGLPSSLQGQRRETGWGAGGRPPWVWAVLMGFLAMSLGHPVLGRGGGGAYGSRRIEDSAELRRVPLSDPETGATARWRHSESDSAQGRDLGSSETYGADRIPSRSKSGRVNGTLVSSRRNSSDPASVSPMSRVQDTKSGCSSGSSGGQEAGCSGLEATSGETDRGPGGGATQVGVEDELGAGELSDPDAEEEFEQGSASEGTQASAGAQNSLQRRALDWRSTHEAGMPAETRSAGGHGFRASWGPRSRNAYASILYAGTPRDYEFFVGMRVALHTVKGTGTEEDIVVLASEDVPQAWTKQLEHDGFRVLAIPNLSNPYAASGNQRATRFRFSMNKLVAWRLTEYARVVLLDADNLVLSSIDELFLCGEFCAAFINPCIFHTGLIVLKPSEETFDDMVRNMGTLAAADAADQGFLNSYFPNLLASPLFKAEKGPLSNVTAPSGLYRLPLGYQMDAIFYTLKSRWEVPCSENKVITFPGSSVLKPWYWWSWPVLPLPLQWHRTRSSTIGFEAESFACTALAILWAALLLWHPVARTAWDLLKLGKARQMPQGSPVKGTEQRASLLKFLTPPERSRQRRAKGQALEEIALPAAVFAAVPLAAVLSISVIPSTAQTFAGWMLFFEGWLALLRIVELRTESPLAIYWLPCYGAFSVIVVALPMYSILAFKLVVLHMLAFGGGSVAVFVYREIMSHHCERNSE